LTAFSGTVTRTSEVRPELLYGTFRCDDCGTLAKDIAQDFAYTEPPSCANATCMNRSSWTLDAMRSKFCDWQKVRVQENSGEVPSGSMPRTIEVILRNETVDRCKPGDKVIFTGVPIAVPDVAQFAIAGQKPLLSRQSNDRGEAMGVTADVGISGLKSLGVRDLTYRICFLGLSVRPAEQRSTLNALHDILASDDSLEKEIQDGTAQVNSDEALFRGMEQEEIAEVISMKENNRLLQDLVASVAPHISGHDRIKEGILLQLLGGVHKKTGEGISLRGDINVCIVGDPSTAKSQFLKYVVNMMPRAVYTSGKASSAAGLTASVVKDEETNEFTIEAGALMLADNVRLYFREAS
jgi:DNA replication licensing factor MCM6